MIDIHDRKIQIAIGITVALGAYTLYRRKQAAGSSPSSTGGLPVKPAGTVSSAGNDSALINQLFGDLSARSDQNAKAMAALTLSTNNAIGGLATGTANGFTSLASGEAAAFKSFGTSIDNMSTNIGTAMSAGFKSLGDLSNLVLKAVTDLTGKVTGIDTRTTAQSGYMYNVAGMESDASCYQAGSKGGISRYCIQSKGAAGGKAETDGTEASIFATLQQKYGPCYNASSDKFDLNCVGKMIVGGT